MRKIFAMLLSLTFLGSIYAQNDKASVLDNGDFETDISGWTLTVKNGAVAEISHIDTLGQKVLKVHIIDTSDTRSAGDITLQNNPQKLDAKYTTSLDQYKILFNTDVFTKNTGASITVGHYYNNTFKSKTQDLTADAWLLDVKRNLKVGGSPSERAGEFQAQYKLGTCPSGTYYFDSISFEVVSLLDVTPVLSNVSTTATVASSITATSDTTATIYLVPDGTAATPKAIRDASIDSTTATPNIAANLSTNYIIPGNYVVYAIDSYNVISAPSATIAITTSADVTAPALSNINPTTMVTGESFSVTSSETARLYLVTEGASVNASNIESMAVLIENITANTPTNISTTGIAIGSYDLYARDASNNLSTKVDIELTNDVTSPTLSAVTTGSVIIGTLVYATSNEDGKLYFVTNGTLNNITDIRAYCADSVDVLANSAGSINTALIYNGNYIFYAVDGSGNISDPSSVITINRPTPTEYEFTFSETNVPSTLKDTVISQSGIDVSLNQVRWINDALRFDNKQTSSIEWISKFGLGSIHNSSSKGLELYINNILIDTIEVNEVLTVNQDVQNNNPDTIKVFHFEANYNLYIGNKLPWSEFGKELTDNFPPEISNVNTNITQGNNFGAKSSEDGWLYFVPSKIQKIRTEISNNALDSVEAVANIKSVKNVGGTTPGNYIMYAIDLAGNISDSSATITVIKDSTTVKLMDVSTPATVGDSIKVKADWAATVYLVPNGTAKVLADIKTAKIDSVVVIDSVYGKIATAGLTPANYLVYAIEASEHISDAWTVTLEAPADQTAPELSNITAGPINIGDTIFATSNEDGVLYLVPEGISKGLIEVKDAAVTKKSVLAGTADTLLTAGIKAGSYIVYAADAVGNLSDASPAILINIPPDETAPVLSNVTTGSITIGDNVVATSNEPGMLYLVADSTGKVLADITTNKIAEATAVSGTAATLSSSNATAGRYIVYAVDTSYNISNASAAIIINNPPDLIAPVLSNVTTGSVFKGENIVATSNEEGIIYLVPEGTAKVLETIELEKVAEIAVQAGIEANLSTVSVDTGLYILFAVDTAENISNASAAIHILQSNDSIAPVLTFVASDTITVGETIAITVNEDATVYLVADSINNVASEIVTAKVASAAASRDTEVLLRTVGVKAGSYIIYAIDAAKNVSLPSDTIIITPSLDITAPELNTLTVTKVSIEDSIFITSNENGTLYLVPAGEYTTVAALKDSAVYTTVVSAGVTHTIIATTPGTFQVYAIDAVGNISIASDTITVVAIDKTVPVLSNVTVGELILGDTIYATSNENGILYLVADSINATFSDIVVFAQVTTTATANVEAIFNTENLNEGNYVVYAMDEANNISEASAIINLIAPAIEPIDTVAPVLSNVTSGEVTIGDAISAMSSEKGMLYLVADSIEKVLADITANNVANATAIAETAAELGTEGLLAGTYVVYAVDTAENISDASAVITLVERVVVDTVAPVLTNVTEGTIAPGTDITATSNEDATLYLVHEGTAREIAAITAAQVANNEAVAETAAILSTTDLADGNYVVYAIDAAENVSDASEVITLLTVGVKEQMFNILTVYPNPANNYIILNNSELIEAVILNIAGETVKQINLANSKVEISDLQNGVYIVNAKSNNGTYYLGRFIKN